MSELPSFFTSNAPLHEIVDVYLEPELTGEIHDVMGQLTELTREKMHSLDSDHLGVKKETLLNDKERIYTGELDTQHLDKEEAMRKLQRKINEINRILLSRDNIVISQQERDTDAEKRRSTRRRRRRKRKKRSQKHKKKGSKRRRKILSSRRRKISCRIPTKYPKK